MDRYEHVVVVGAGLAGVSAVGSLREQGYGGQITLVGAEERLPYARPPLSKAALLDTPRSADELLRPESFYRDRDVTLRLGTAATALRPREGVVELGNGNRLRADAVLLCTGGSPRSINVPGADLGGVCTLRTAEDAARIRDHLERGGPVVVVGGGFIGTEVAAAASARGCPTTVVEAGALPMLGALGADVATRLAEAHRERGVTVRTGVGVRAFTGDGRVRNVVLTDGSTLQAELVVVGVGMAPEVRLAVDAGLTVGDGVQVDALGRTSNPSVWAAGDVAAVSTGDEHRRFEHWQNAKERGSALARAVLGGTAPPAFVPWFWSDQYDLNIQVAGEPAPHDARCWRGDVEALSFSVLHHRDGVLTGITAVNSGKDVRPAIELIRRGTALDIDALADASTTVKALLKAAR
ncbi:NAD(P)/FAD-dependent oxidoreductase [Streptomyces sp. TP-A0874]|uniref:NAD(P)/FAD-dependent oxidoreductase n=1 Tax=Streptomyces sp. TP-A0874 TaxID=549819 RepID=UPI0008536243|nr:FAD-dependent oxidoreductase [Streptomyces sp. TP-A0874]